MSRLILTRTEDETIVSHGPVTIRVVRVNGKRVTIACEAAPDVLILRGEVERKDSADGKSRP